MFPNDLKCRAFCQFLKQPALFNSPISVIMMKNIAYLLLSLQLAACGFKGDLYLPKENDDAKFGAIQTGIDFKRTPTNPTEKK